MTEFESLKELETEIAGVSKEIDKIDLEMQIEEEKLPDDIDIKRWELIRLSEEGEISKTAQYIKKANKSIVEKLYHEYENKKARKANEFISIFIIGKFSDLLSGFNMIGDSKELNDELSKDELLKKDVLNVVQRVSPLIPFIGLLSGGITTAKHIAKHRLSKKKDES